MIKTYAQLVKTITESPKCHLAVNIQTLGVNLDMLEQHPVLADYVQSILSDNNPKNVQGWEYFSKAYFDLKEQGLLNIPQKRDAELKAFSSMLEAKAMGPCLIPKAEIKELVIKTTKKKVTSYQIEYNAFVGLVEQYYGIDSRGLFERGSVSPAMAAELGLTQSAFTKACNVSPYDSYDAARIALLSKCREQVNHMPYVDMWHYHMDTQFPEVGNGSVQYFSFYEDLDMRVEYVNRKLNRQEKALVDPRLFLWYDQIIVKELGQLSIYKGVAPEEVEFWHSW